MLFQLSGNNCPKEQKTRQIPPQNQPLPQGRGSFPASIVHRVHKYADLHPRSTLLVRGHPLDPDSKKTEKTNKKTQKKYCKKDSDSMTKENEKSKGENTEKSIQKNSEKEKRSKFIKFRVSEEEYEAIERKFRVSRLSSKSEFIRLMIFEGIIVHFSEKDLNEMQRLLSNIANNINQIAVRANLTGNVYADDLEEIKRNQVKIWQLQKSLLSKVQKAKL